MCNLACSFKRHAYEQLHNFVAELGASAPLLKELQVDLQKEAYAHFVDGSSRQLCISEHSDFAEALQLLKEGV